MCSYVFLNISMYISEHSEFYLCISLNFVSHFTCLYLYVKHILTTNFYMLKIAKKWFCLGIEPKTCCCALLCYANRLRVVFCLSTASLAH